MNKIELKIDKFVELIEKHGIQKDNKFYIDPIVMKDIVEQELKLSMTYNLIVPYIKDLDVNLKEEEIKNYLEKKLISDDPELKERFENRKSKSKNPANWTKDEIDSYTQDFIDDLTMVKYIFEPYTLKYFKNYVEILKQKSLKLFEIVDEIIDFSLSKDKMSEKLTKELEKYDIEILENGYIYYEDLIRLLTPLVENVLELKEKVKDANNLETYLNFSVSEHSLLKNGIMEAEIYPLNELQAKSYNFDTIGYIRLSDKQKQEIRKQESDDFSAWLDKMDEDFNDIDSKINQPQKKLKM